MELSKITQPLRARRLLAALVVLVALAVGVGVKETAHSIPTGAATVQILVDSPQSALADLKQDTIPLVSRAQVFAQLMTSGAVLDAIAKTAGVSQNEVTAEGPYSGAGQALDLPTPSEARSAQVVATKALYHFTFVPDTDLPLVTASVEGPSPSAAGRVADAVYPGVEAWLRQLQGSGAVPAARRVTIRQLGDAQAGTVNSGSSTILAGAAAVAVLLVGLLSLVALERSRRAGGTLVVAAAHTNGIHPLPHGVKGPERGHDALAAIAGSAEPNEPQTAGTRSGGPDRVGLKQRPGPSDPRVGPSAR